MGVMMFTFIVWEIYGFGVFSYVFQCFCLGNCGEPWILWFFVGFLDGFASEESDATLQASIWSLRLLSDAPGLKASKRHNVLLVARSVSITAARAWVAATSALWAAWHLGGSSQRPSGSCECFGGSHERLRGSSRRLGGGLQRFRRSCVGQIFN